MADVFVGDAVLASRRMDLHEDLVYYEKPVAGWRSAQPTVPRPRDLLLAKSPLALAPDLALKD